MTNELQTLREALDVAQAMLTAITQRIDALQPTRERVPCIVPSHRDAITPNVPEGFDTVLGYLAKYHPDVLDHVDYYDPQVTQRDGFKLSHLQRRLCAAMSPVYVDAPPCLRVSGITQVRAYPVNLLAQRWG